MPAHVKVTSNFLVFNPKLAGRPGHGCGLTIAISDEAMQRLGNPRRINMQGDLRRGFTIYPETNSDLGYGPRKVGSYWVCSAGWNRSGLGPEHAGRSIKAWEPNVTLADGQVTVHPLSEKAIQDNLAFTLSQRALKLRHTANEKRRITALRKSVQKRKAAGLPVGNPFTPERARAAVAKREDRRTGKVTLTKVKAKTPVAAAPPTGQFADLTVALATINAALKSGMRLMKSEQTGEYRLVIG